MPLDLALLSALIGSNYPCLELISWPKGVRAIEIRLYVCQPSNTTLHFIISQIIMYDLLESKEGRGAEFGFSELTFIHCSWC